MTGLTAGFESTLQALRPPWFAGTARGWQDRRNSSVAVVLFSLLMHLAMIGAWLNQRLPVANVPVQRVAVRIVQPLGLRAVAPQAVVPEFDNPDTPSAASRHAPPRPLGSTRENASPPTHPPAHPSDHDPQPPAVAEEWSAGQTNPPAFTPMPAPSVASAPQPTPLNLNLPATARQANSGGHSSVREQALNDPRSRGQHTSAETRMAQTLGSDDTLTEEDMGNGRRRFRKGAACVDVHDTRIAHLNPFDAVSRDIKVAKPCD